MGFAGRRLATQQWLQRWGSLTVNGPPGSLACRAPRPGACPTEVAMAG